LVPAAGREADFRHLPDGYVATAKMSKTNSSASATRCRCWIVVVNTSAGAKYGRQDYVTSGCGMGYEATMYLLERGVRLTGIDGWAGTRCSLPRRNTPRPRTPA
jgi:kynurenine formamidase